MYIGTFKITLRIPENQSLKGKRRIVKSLSSRINNQFKVAIAEVDSLDRWQLATLGIACVSNESRHAEEILSKVKNFIEANMGEFELLDEKREVIRI